MEEEKMLKMKKTISALLAVVMMAALCAVSPAMAETTKVMFADFTDKTATSLPMHKTDEEGARNDADRIKPVTDIYYGDSGQSGIWSVSGSNSQLKNYYVTDSGMSLAAAAKCNVFVMRFYSSTDSDAFNVLFYKDSSTYKQVAVYVSKAGWQEVTIPVSAIEEKLAIEDFSYFLLQKGGWGIDKTVFNQENKLYFDSMWFENRVYNVAADADEGVTLYHTDNLNLKASTDVVYSDSSSSMCLSTTATSNRSIYSAELSTLNLDSTMYDKVTYRLYSEQKDQVVLTLYYTNESGASKFKAQTYEFSEDASNIGKWVEVTIDISDFDYTVDKVGLNYNGWGTSHNGSNNLYIDKIWFGDVEDINGVFSYKQSAYDGAENVGVFDAIALEFDAPPAAAIACDAVEVTRDGNIVTEFDAWSDENMLYVKTDAAMAFDSEYEITVTSALNDQRGYTLDAKTIISFKTASAYLAIDSIELVDTNGDKLSAVPAADTAVSAVAEIINGSDEKASFVAIIAMYDSTGRLVKVSVSNPTEFNANMAVSHELKASDTVTSDTASVRGFLWSGTDTMIPFAATEQI